ncbi:biotin--[acetyl-CoA-carboxylase] ligase [Phnomibacter ginsenosidimutans]|uniref:Biotin--[acetyl-CoA-carboxylase] ligase n=1 Tax=Phnomibacter ginsenosidimutans TaxID=2676868 RepID=A0A6I6GX15_9BACT|nr:biotin--[acetyl-CoA-carboxylase] ligase [Phnomibacter ginsenosidimutans]QGW27151.1 biotin--[acetyl-CoA-carboxylase] ligase [Phnomibacter ginsenosidimutans]
MNLPTIGHSFEVFDTINSTNMYAMQCIREGMAVHGSVYFAHEQTQGRGQWGKKWWSEPGENIQLTMVLQPLQLAPSQYFRLSAAIAAGAYDFLHHHAQGGWNIKWPNDLYWGDRKAGGILIENVMQQNQWRWAVCGIGINVNSTRFDPALPNPTSLSLVAGRRFNAELLGRSLCVFVKPPLAAADGAPGLEPHSQRLQSGAVWGGAAAQASSAKHNSTLPHTKCKRARPVDSRRKW